MNRTDRLVAMVMYLQGRRLVRAEDMAAHFEISVRTVYRDLAALSEAGVPITGEAGVGYSLMKSYHLPPVMLTAEEASALFVGAELAKKFTDGSLQPRIEAALLKLRAVLPRDRQDYVDRLSKKTVVIGPSTGGVVPLAEREWLVPLQEAAVSRRVVEITYRGRGRDQDTVRKVEPLGVVFHNGAWYLVAWCRLRQDLRHFRLDRMRKIITCDEVFTARTEFSLTGHLQMTSSQEPMNAVRVRFSHAVIDRARRESMVSFLEEKSVPAGVEVAMATYSLEWFAAWIVSFGGNAEALEPESLRERVRAVAERALERHLEGAIPEAQLA